jgi:hypothetical protein
VLCGEAQREALAKAAARIISLPSSPLVELSITAAGRSF